LSCASGTSWRNQGFAETSRDRQTQGRTHGRALFAIRIGRHDAIVLKLWNKTKDMQLDLLGAAPAPVAATAEPKLPITTTQRVAPSAPHLLPLAALCEDPANPRTEFPEAELNELTEDIRQHGILQPIVVHPVDAQGRYRIHFGAKRWRAAQRAGLTEVPVVVRDAPTDPYTQVAENQKRHGLTLLDLARFIQARVNAGDSNATVAKRLGMDLTSVAHHLALLELPPALDAAMQAGRCTSPRTLHELSRLHRTEPDRVQTLLAGEAEITRSAVAAVRAESSPTSMSARRQEKRQQADLLAAAISACERLESALDRVSKAERGVAESDLASLKQRVTELASRLA
jgi:ParB family transcriptional regulator, chromosome partitioning protein